MIINASIESYLGEQKQVWHTSPDYGQHDLRFHSSKFSEVTDLLLENPNLNSTHLFRADILFDSSGKLRTPTEKEVAVEASSSLSFPRISGVQSEAVSARNSPDDGVHPFDTRILWPGFILKRTVVRRLIPRKPQIDRPLVQTCLLLESGLESQQQKWMVVYLPDISNESDMPWYHPPLKGLAYLYEQHGQLASLSIHLLPFDPEIQAVTDRIHRTLLSLLATFVRLAKHDPPSSIRVEHPQNPKSSLGRSLAPSAIKDTIIPQHLVQDTYTRLKKVYATDLISRWVENTEPSKHVFEDLSIAAFLIELWRQMYQIEQFPGFVDIACGNGVLVYILLKEGYNGCGFDARRRKTWKILDIDKYLEERICVPKPFIDALKLKNEEALPVVEIHNGIFEPGTFIISNHADELTPWTPILAAMSASQSPLPFLAIPCCSHALSGAKCRYPPTTIGATSSTINDQEGQPAKGDLKTLRASKASVNNHTDDKSMYACLTRKVIALAEELKFDVEVTLMRIPSTRNIGIVGNRRRDMRRDRETLQQELGYLKPDDEANAHMEASFDKLISRECATSGGIEGAAKIWISRAKKLQTGQGRGKVNLGKPMLHEHDTTT